MSVTAVVRELSAAQKSSSGVSLYTRWVNRPLGRVLAAVAVTAGLSANTVTAISALVTTSGIVLLAAVPPTVGSGVVAAVLLVLGFALDSADGQVSRYTRTGSAAGEWFDHVADAGKMVALHAGVLIGWFRFGDLPHVTWLLVPIAYQVVGVLMFSGGTLADLLDRARTARAAAPAAAVSTAPGGSSTGGPGPAAAPSAPARPSLVRAVGLLPADYGVLALSFVLWGVPEVHRWVYALLLAVNAVILVLLLRRWFRGLRA